MRQGVAYRTDLHAEGKCSRIEVAQQLVAQCGFVLDDVLQFGQIGLRLVDCLKEMIVAVLVCRDVPGLQGFGFAEKISLEERIAQLAGFFVMAARFHLFGQKFDAAIAVCAAPFPGGAGWLCCRKSTLTMSTRPRSGLCFTFSP